MMIQTKLLLVLTTAAIAVIGAYAWRVLPSYIDKKTAETGALGEYSLRVLPSDPIRGKRGAALTIIEFGDIECPYCGAIDEQIAALVVERPDVRLAWKDCPLPSHPNASAAAQAALCAGDQGKYWEYHDRLVKGRDRFGAPLYVSIAEELKLDAERFGKCLENGEKRAQVLSSLNECAASGVEELPWFSVNGKTFSGSGVVANLINELDKK